MPTEQTPHIPAAARTTMITRACPVVLSGLRAFRCVFPERCQKRTLIVGSARLVPVAENLTSDGMLRCESAGRQGVLLPVWVW